MSDLELEKYLQSRKQQKLIEFVQRWHADEAALVSIDHGIFPPTVSH